MSDPNLKRVWGVESCSAFVAGGRWIEGACCKLKIGTEEIRYYRHPELFITDTVREWEREYLYCREFGTQVDYSERQACWIKAVELYSYYKEAIG